MHFIRPALALAATAWCSTPDGGPSHPSCCSPCEASSAWPGFHGIENIFSFGNSYTTTEFDPDGQQPTEDNPMGNPPYPGVTSARPADNWIDFLTTKYNKSSILTYNLAIGGSTVHQTKWASEVGTAATLVDQVYKRFEPRYGKHHPTVPLAREWNSKNTLFTFWFGINDVNGSFEKGSNVTAPWNKEIMAAYKKILGHLYNRHGMRNAVILNVPSIHRSPYIRGKEDAMQHLAKQDLADFNGRILHMVREFQRENDQANIWVYDSYTDFSKVMDDPKTFEQTSFLKNMTDSCDHYGPVGTPEKDTFLEECGVPVNQYFWLNNIHPTYPVHEAVAAQIAQLLGAGPNMC